jgi:hypothetical protein
LARLIRTPVAPITPTIVVPLPVKYRIYFGTPLRPKGPPTPRCGAQRERRASFRPGPDRRRPRCTAPCLFLAFADALPQPRRSRLLHARSGATGVRAAEVAA